MSSFVRCQPQSMKTQSNRTPEAHGMTRPRFKLKALVSALMMATCDAWSAQPGTVLPAGVLPQQVPGLYPSTRTSPTDITISPGITPPPKVVNGQVVNQTVPEFLKSRGVSPNRTNGLTVDQGTNQKAIIQWNSFNIGSGSTVYFKQPNAGASVLNRIADADPSIIQGSMIADGQVYLLNQNGILFDRGSQINLQGLVASSLGLTDSAFLNGTAQGMSYSATASSGPVRVGRYGPADASVPELRTKAGGSIALIGAEVTNDSGLISAPDGQVILAAGQSVLLKDNSPGDVTLRGLLVQVTAPSGGLNLSGL